MRSARGGSTAAQLAVTGSWSLSNFVHRRGRARELFFFLPPTTQIPEVPAGLLQDLPNQRAGRHFWCSAPRVALAIACRRAVPDEAGANVSLPSWQSLGPLSRARGVRLAAVGVARPSHPGSILKLVPLGWSSRFHHSPTPPPRQNHQLTTPRPPFGRTRCVLCSSFLEQASGPPAHIALCDVGGLLPSSWKPRECPYSRGTRHKELTRLLKPVLGYRLERKGAGGKHVVSGLQSW